MRALAILAVLLFPAAALAQLGGFTHAAMPAAGVRVEHFPATQQAAAAEVADLQRQLAYCCQRVQFAQPWEREGLFEQQIRLRLRLRVLLRVQPQFSFEGFDGGWGGGWDGGWGGGGWQGIQPFPTPYGRGFGFDYQGPLGGQLRGWGGGFGAAPFDYGGGGVDPFCPSCPRSGYGPMPPADQAAPTPTLPGGGGGYINPSPGLNQGGRPIPPLSQLPLQRYSTWR